MNFVNEDNFLENVRSLLQEKIVEKLYLRLEIFQMTNLQFIDDDPLWYNFKELSLFTNIDRKGLIVPYLVVKEFKKQCISNFPGQLIVEWFEHLEITLLMIWYLVY